jgi:acetyl-CoA carboxylase/biotin carboxylase 1
VFLSNAQDISAAAEYIKLADEFVEIPGGSNNQNYANVELIVDIAQRYTCDAVFAGWGHASENPKLPDAFAATNGKIAFMGPGSVAMAALGDKIASTLIAQSVGVPCVPWSGAGIKVDFKETGEVDPEAFQSSCVTNPEAAAEMGEKMGYPIMVKASEGGGGKGIRVVRQTSEMIAAYRQVAGEVPGSPIFLMTMMHDARHLEVQLIADAYGEAIALSGRDCSVQRRCQKIIEEGPQVAAPPDTWVKMENAAIALAKEVGYRSAGTVEYLYVPKTDSFYFLELNPRLQVEHPCSEWITGCNLPALQLNVAMGVPLGNIPDIRRFYGKPKYDSTVVDFATMKGIVNGHVIAGRITAENPDEGFQPTSGSITELKFRNTPHVWGYFSTYSGVHEFSDSQFGHLFAWGINREAARRNMVCALKELDIRGDIRTTVEYLITLMETPAFCDNEISTEWLDGLIAKRVKAARPDTFISTICGALYKAHKRENSYLSDIQNCLEKGQMPPKVGSFIRFATELILDDVKYEFMVYRRGKTLFEVTTNGSSVWAEMRPLNDGGLHICLNGSSHVAYARDDASMLRLNVDGKTVCFSKEYDPTQIESEMAAKLVRNLVPDGGHVNKGEEIVELEVMKMFLTLRAPESGLVENVMLEGSVLNVGDLIARLTLDDPSKVKKAVNFEGKFPGMKPPVVHGDKIHQEFRAALEMVNMTLAGYRPLDISVMHNLKSCMLNAALGLLEVSECLSTISSRIPNSLIESLDGLLASCEGQSTIDYSAFQKAVDTCLKTLEPSASDALVVVVQPLTRIIEKYLDGPLGMLASTAAMLLQKYIDVEVHFQMARNDSNEEMIYMLREVTDGDPALIMEHLVSHANLQAKNQLAVALLNVIDEYAGDRLHSLTDMLAELATWQSPTCVGVSRLSREILVKHRSMSTERMISEMGLALGAISTADAAEREEFLETLTSNQDYVSSVLLGFVFDADKQIQLSAIRAYTHRIYRAYVVKGWIEVPSSGPGVALTAQWTFMLPTREDDETRSVSPMRKMKRVDSLENLLAKKDSKGVEADTPVRLAQITVLENMAALEGELDTVLDQFGEAAAHLCQTAGQPVNILSLFMRETSVEIREEARVAQIHATLHARKKVLRQHMIRCVTCMPCLVVWCISKSFTKLAYAGVSRSSLSALTSVICFTRFQQRWNTKKIQSSVT